MNNCILIIISILLLFLSLACTNSIDLSRPYSDTDKKIVKKYCYECHSPSGSFVGPELHSMYKNYGPKKIKKYMVKEFIEKSKSHSYHKLALSKEEVESIILTLRDGFGK